MGINDAHKGLLWCNSTILEQFFITLAEVLLASNMKMLYSAAYSSKMEFIVKRYPYWLFHY